MSSRSREISKFGAESTSGNRDVFVHPSPQHTGQYGNSSNDSPTLIYQLYLHHHLGVRQEIKIPASTASPKCVPSCHRIRLQASRTKAHALLQFRFGCLWFREMEHESYCCNIARYCKFHSRPSSHAGSWGSTLARQALALLALAAEQLLPSCLTKKSRT